MTDEQAAELRRLAESAHSVAPEKWCKGGHYRPTCKHGWISSGNLIICHLSFAEKEGVDPVGTESLATFIAGADPQAILDLLAERERLRTELALWRPLSTEEAEKALDKAKAVPLSEARIAEIVKRATDPAVRLPNNEQAQLAADNERLNEMLRRTGYGQGQIDAYVAQCEEMDQLKAENERLRAALDNYQPD